ncbi:uncharacterized protein VTP21DRAFT_1342 [Calcarisporiella thermophila]|uniref:uncharacterized protein n=1 Tax=Calcarisporiella thermophila TaxID=911321 RepID=UPI00374272E1
MDLDFCLFCMNRTQAGDAYCSDACRYRDSLRPSSTDMPPTPKTLGPTTHPPEATFHGIHPLSPTAPTHPVPKYSSTLPVSLQHYGFPVKYARRTSYSHASLVLPASGGASLELEEGEKEDAGDMKTPKNFLKCVGSI